MLFSATEFVLFVTAAKGGINAEKRGLGSTALATDPTRLPTTAGPRWTSPGLGFHWGQCSPFTKTRHADLAFTSAF